MFSCCKESSCKMLSLGKFPTQVQHNSVLHNPISQNFGFPSKLVFSFSANRVNPLNIRALFGKKPTGLCSNALKTKRKGDFNVAEVEGSDDFDDDFMDIDDGEFEVDDDEVVVPLKNMKKWLENRPRGFGEGKVYDTSIEDKLMEEIEQSREAQLANINKLKSNSIRSNPKQEITKLDKGSMHIPDGIRVRLVNLPKKKNIHKDLRLAFKGVSGILNIVPVVSGNEKTRDPVCKGLAFIDFQYKDEAKRFVENFSGKRVSFGKVQKQIECEVLNSKLPKPARDQSVKEVDHTPPQAVLSLDDVFDAGFDMDVSPLNSEEESDSSEHDYEDEKHISAQRQDDEEIKATSSTNNSNFVEEQEVTEELAINSSSSKHGRKLMQNDRKVAPKTKKDKIAKLNIPGSAKRLKIREKAVLTGVFSKYGANATSSIKEPELMSDGFS